MRALAIVSGGLDSATLAYHLKAQGYDLRVLSFNYGQRHHRELKSASEIARMVGARFDVVDIASFGRFLRGSALTDATVPVPHGHYAAENMRSTVVPMRNTIMLSMACAIAAADGIQEVYLGVHAGDHPIYPDCRPQFIAAFNDLLRVVEAKTCCSDPALVRVLAPFVHMSKSDIVALGARLEVPYEITWSCYEGGDVHCGQCGTCVERKEAFALAGVTDPTIYLA